MRKNIILQSLIRDLEILAKKENVAIWKRIANDLQKPTRSKRELSVSKLQTFAKKGETMIVPGKILGNGNIDEPITVVSHQISKTAKDKIIAAKGSYRTISEEMKQNPKGNKIRIIG